VQLKACNMKLVTFSACRFPFVCFCWRRVWSHKGRESIGQDGTRQGIWWTCHSVQLYPDSFHQRWGTNQSSCTQIYDVAEMSNISALW